MGDINMDDIIKNHMISSYGTNISFRNQLIHTFKLHYTQNVKYHILWLFFHSFSFAYPENPSEEYKIELANFIVNIIPKNLGSCGSCQNDYSKYIESINIFRVVSSKNELSHFFVNLHNYINVKKFTQNNTLYKNVTKFNILINDQDKLTQPIQYNYTDVQNKYIQLDYIPLLQAKFNINLVTLIGNSSLATFYELFNNINFDFNDTIFNIDISIN
jgi:hypothetical protein